MTDKTNKVAARVPATQDEVVGACFKTFFMAVAIIVIFFSSCAIHENHSIGKAIKNGANPLDAHCAFSSHMASVCAVRATK